MLVTGERGRMGISADRDGWRWGEIPVHVQLSPDLVSCRSVESCVLLRRRSFNHRTFTQYAYTCRHSLLIHTKSLLICGLKNVNRNEAILIGRHSCLRALRATKELTQTENHPANCMWYAVWFRVCICWCTAPLCSETWIGEVLSLHHTIRQLFTWPSSPTAWFRNSFPASATLCLPNTTN